MIANKMVMAADSLDPIIEALLAQLETDRLSRLRPLFCDPESRLRPLQEQAAQELLHLIGVDFLPRRLRELLVHLDAIVACRCLLKLLRFDERTILESGTRYSEIRTAFAAIYDAERLMVNSCLDDLPIFTVASSHRPERIRELFEKLHHALLLENYCRIVPAHFHTHHQPVCLQVRETLKNWGGAKLSDLQRYYDVLVRWREDALEFQRVLVIIGKRATALASDENAAIHPHLDLLKQQTEMAVHENSPAQAICRLKSVISQIDRFDAAASAGEKETAGSGNVWEPWERPSALPAILILLALLAAATLTWVGKYRNEVERIREPLANPLQTP